jgi:hypothetical protein
LYGYVAGTTSSQASYFRDEKPLSNTQMLNAFAIANENGNGATWVRNTVLSVKSDGSVWVTTIQNQTRSVFSPYVALPSPVSVGMTFSRRNPDGSTAENKVMGLSSEIVDRYSDDCLVINTLTTYPTSEKQFDSLETTLYAPGVGMVDEYFKPRGGSWKQAFKYAGWDFYLSPSNFSGYTPPPISSGTSK